MIRYTDIALPEHYAPHTLSNAPQIRENIQTILEAHADMSQVPTQETWHDAKGYLYGVDLFNHGFMWECHEVWEELWHQCGKTGECGQFIQGLIQLAVAVLKYNEGNEVGAGKLFGYAEKRLRGGTYLGIHPTELLHDVWVYVTQQVPEKPVIELRLF